ncbi:hypothetical protein I317_03462 [Kwoniella heveanensis CBS 569]|nr:hypothetical protein I317_03462 [Kwoniella heveanensis CBS 569]
MSSSNSTFIHLHTLDLRIHDSPSLHIAHQPNDPSTHFLPVYIFDPRQLDLSFLPNSPASPSSKGGNGVQKEQDESAQYGPKRTRSSPLSRVGGFHRTSPYRLRFLLEAVFELRESYRRSGGDMLIGYGKPEVLLPSLVQRLKQDGEVSGVWAQREYTVEEVGNLRRISEALTELGIDLNLVDSKTLLPPAHLPFDPSKNTPDVYTQFRTKVEGMGLHLDAQGGGMLVPPLKTAVETQDGGPKVSIDKNGGRLKPFPTLDLGVIELGGKQGGWIKQGDEADSMTGMYEALSRPLFDSSPLAGWSSSVSPGKSGKRNVTLPPLHGSSPIPFSGSEKAALDRLEDYIGHPPSSSSSDSDSGRGEKGWVGGNKARHYKETRNGLMGEGFSTKFSAWLSLGSLSPKEAGWRIGQMLEALGRDKEVYKNVYWIIFELLWRDFFQYTVYKYSLTSNDDFHPNSTLFNPDGFSSQIDTYPQDARPNVEEWHYPNLDDTNDVGRRWCEGLTGVPFIDANMRELRETGWMSNRGRQNVASFLTKDLYCDWRIGAEFFEMHLVDYDTCSNWGNWQYQAGVGNDPRSSRQFNPLKQAKDYDPDNAYVRLWLPELKDVPDSHIQTPWLYNEKSKLGGYPSKPLVELPQWKKFYPGQGGSKGGRDRHRKGGGGGGKAKGNSGKGPKNSREQ